MNNFLKGSFLLPFILCLAFFSYWVFTHYIFHDLVWDELVSLKNFVLVDLKTTVTHYPDVNNHLLFNLINNLYCKLIHIGTIYEAMDNVVLMRLYPLFLSLITVFYVFRIGQRFFNANAGFMAAIVLLTTIPFLNFTMQLRGYTMSMTFMAMAIYYLWSFEKKSSWLTGLMSVLSVFGLLYSIPSNIYFVLALGIIYLIKYLIEIRKDISSRPNDSFLNIWIKNQTFLILFFIGLGSVLAFLAYLPILEALLNERHLQQLKGQSFYMHNLEKVIPFVLHYILSYRFLLLIPLFFIYYKVYSNATKKKWEKEDYYFLFILAIIILSFLISLIRGDKPHQRTFTPLAVVFAVMAGSATYYYLKNIKWLQEKNLLSFILIFVYSVLSFFYCNYLIQSTLHRAIISGDKVYNMFYNFYQSDEYNMKYLDPLIADALKTKYPILMAREIDRVAEGDYLQKHGLDYFSTVWAKQSPAENEAGYQYQVLLEMSQGMGKEPAYNSIGFPPSIRKEDAMLAPLFAYLYQQNTIDQSNPKCYVLTFAPRWFETVMKSSLPKMKYERLNVKQNYHNIYLISRK